jgi:formimidoylglutamate deiminase
MVRRLKSLHFEQALLPDGWADNVLIEIADNGDIAAVTTGGETAGAVSGCLLPGVANLHSHAHQRAMAGFAERAGPTSDSFWTWRDVMYQHLERIEPEHLHAIAAQAYIEMLKAGYTRVAEFQYLHHQSDGSRYDNIAEMSLQTLMAARKVGIGITNLPVHYQFGGFGGLPTTTQQRRFAVDPERYLQIVDGLKQASRGDADVITGIAAHSLRAVTRETFDDVLDEFANRVSLPVHIHIAEQVQEVDSCIAWSGARPVEYLYDNFAVDDHWCLIHATHMIDDETRRVAASGAVVGLCPTTEANLGDGLFNADLFAGAGGRYGVGSDSNISISPVEEMRWLEYMQRIDRRGRNLMADGPGSSTGRTIFDRVLAGGARACGYRGGKIESGARADLIVLDTSHPLLCERSRDTLLDSWIFSGNDKLVRDVYVGGMQVVRDGRHPLEAQIETDFKRTLKALRCNL